MKMTLIKYLLYVCSVFVVSCTPIPYLMFINNTGKTITVRSENESATISTNASGRVRWPGNTLSLEIRFNESSNWNYRVNTIPKSNRKTDSTYMQIQSNGWIYLVPVGTTASLSILPPQPVNLPWKPKSTSP